MYVMTLFYRHLTITLWKIKSELIKINMWDTDEFDKNYM